MTLFSAISIVISLAALLSYINHRWLKLPPTIGVMIISLIIGISLKVCYGFFPKSIDPLKNAVLSFDFSDFVLNIVLCFLLFAGSLHVKYEALKEVKKTVFSFAIFGTLISTFLVAILTHLVLLLFGYKVDFIICLLFGSLISPTDPIAVIGILSKFNIPKKLKTEIIGESLFNDGVGVILFTVIYTVYKDGLESLTALKVISLFGTEVIGGLLMGALVGYIGLKLMKSIDHYQTEILITLGIVMGGYSLSQLIHASGPLAMVVAGLIIGNTAKAVMSDTTAEYVDKFWELIDETCNIILFMLMGLEIFIVRIELQYVFAGMIMIVMVLASRFISLVPTYLLFSRHSQQKILSLNILTWGGLRGGISIALALSLYKKIPHSELFLVVTYCIVFFSIIVQGLTIDRLLKKFKTVQ